MVSYRTPIDGKNIRSVLVTLLTALCLPALALSLPFNDEMVHDQFKTNDFMRENPRSSVPTDSLERFVENREAARALSNPLRNNPEAEANGERLFRANCMVCHGVYEDAQYQTPKVIAPMIGVDLSLPLQEPNAAGEMGPKPDGHYFGYIYFGGLALMPRYGWKFSMDEHWQIVSYVQKMQDMRAANDGAAN